MTGRQFAAIYVASVLGVAVAVFWVGLKAIEHFEPHYYGRQP